MTTIVETPLSWTRQDIEQRMAFAGGRYTQVNLLLSGLIAVALTVLFYLVMWMLLDGPYSWFAEVFIYQGPTQPATCLLGFWSMVILIIKGRKLALQRRTLAYQIVPDDHDFVLSASNVHEVLNQLYATVDDPRHFVLFNRIAVALSNLRNLGRVTDVDDILRSQAEQDESMMETSYSMLNGFVWAIPVLGFIGTVLGLSQSISNFTGVLGNVTEISQITSSLKEVTAGLATAFGTTLVALVVALLIQLWATLLKKSEQEFLDVCSEYCGRYVVGKLRIMPFESDTD